MPHTSKKNRVAQKIVDRFTSDPASATSYDLRRIQRAFRRVGRTLPESDVTTWQDAKGLTDFGGIPIKVTTSELAASEPSLGQLGWSATSEPLPELKSLSLPELKAEAKARKLKGYSRLKKAELVTFLEEDGA